METESLRGIVTYELYALGSMVRIRPREVGV